jgi:NADPH:quinone reductase
MVGGSREVASTAPLSGAVSAAVTALEMHVHRTGGADALTPREIQLPAPGQGEVRVKIEAAGVAYADLVMRRGVYPGVRVPFTPGYDLVGRVEALGPGVDAFRVGARVAAVTVTGSYASHRNVEARWLVPAPDEGDPAALVAATLNGLTAWQMFHRINPPEPNEFVLVHGAAGGVGVILLELARLGGVNAIGTASPGKRHVVEARGGSYVDYRSEDVVDVARRRSDGGVVLAFDHIGGRHLRSVSLAAVRAGGAAILYGLYETTRGGKVRPAAVLDMLLRSRLSSQALFAESVGAIGYNVTSWRNARVAAYRHDLERVLGLVASGQLVPEIGATFPLREAAAAQRLLENRSVAGKVVLIP